MKGKKKETYDKAAKLYFKQFGGKYFETVEEAHNFLRWNVQVGNLSPGYIWVLATYEERGERFDLGNMENRLYIEWKRVWDAWH